LLDSDTWVLVAGIVGALAPLWLSALTRGATSQEEPGVMMTALHLAEELDLREVQRRRATHWLLNTVGIAAGVLIVTWWVFLKYQGAHLWVALGAWMLVALLAGYALPLGLGERFAMRLSGWMERSMGGLTWLLSPFLWLVLILRRVLGSDDDELLRQYRQNER